MKLKRHHTANNLTGKTPDEKTAFFLAASHQLKAPVAIIQWCLQSMLEEPGVNQHARGMAQKALTQADAMSLLISDMLHVFRVENRKHTDALEPVSLNTVIDEVFHQCEPLAQRENVRLVRGQIENLPDILAEEMYLKQALINLTDNAIRYSKTGGKVVISASTKKDCIEIAVSDEGIGIPEAEQSRLFSEFFRGEEAKIARHEGTGLGLVLVKKIVEAFGGSIHFESRLHKGTTFTVKFPLSL